MTSTPSPSQPPSVHGRRTRRSFADLFRGEVAGGMMLLIAASLALVLANSPLRDAYESVRDHHLDIASLGLNLSIGNWASDGLLVIFFFVVGIELKRELVTGELRNPAAAALPVVAAIGGMAVPALLYVTIVGSQNGDLNGWAVPMATDIAFALGVLAVVGRGLPSALRTFLLTLAIVDDLIAIIVIALFYTSTLNLWALLGSAAGLLLFAVLHRKGVRGWYLYVPLAVVIWALMVNSGVHATIAGVAIGMLLRTVPRGDEKQSPAEHIAHLTQPYSAGLAVPVFALFAAGVAVSGDTLPEMAREPEALGVITGLFLGKLIGVFGTAFLAAKFTKARLSPELAWADVAGAAILAGVGFTVSLLISELAFSQDGAVSTAGEHVKAAVLIGSLISAVVATVVLRARGRAYQRRRAARPDERAASGR